MTRFDEFLDAALKNDKYEQEIKGNGGFDYNRQVTQLIALSNKINYRLLIYLFGDQMGAHLAQKYVECDYNLLRFLGAMDPQYRFFLLHELKTNESLFAHC